MPLITIDEGEILLLGRALNKATPDNCILKLYTNDITPADGNTVASYTEMSGYGYSAVTLTGANWTVTTVSNKASAAYAQQTFTLTSGPVSAYGYFVTNAAGTTVLWAERFTGAPFSIPAGGGTIKITPNITLTKE